MYAIRSYYDLWSIDHSPMMLALTALDVLVIALTLREWHERRRA